jgi:small subunit ribosomal protein S20
MVNRARRSQARTLVKRFEATMSQGDAKAAAEQLPGVVRKLDKVASMGTMHKKTASRKRSRLTRRLNALKAKQAAPA